MARPPVSSRLEFRVLGPVEAARDGRPIELGGKRQRALLAALLIDANRTVSTSRLIEELFGAEVSRVTENRVQAGISRLRRALDNGETGNGAASVLVTRPGGYLLRVDSDQLDYAMFERLSEEGREALSRHDPATAATLLRRALSLWRGPAFGDLSLVELAQGEIRRLDELRVAAVMDRVSADMMLGADAELVPELEAMVAEHPLQERLLGQLMLALYRSGRQADALEVYRVQRRILRDRLGLDPGSSLAELERSILRHDPDIAAVARVPRGPADGNGRVTVCPYKGLAPFDAADSEFFCGRERVINDLVARVASSRLVGVVGASGVGKSSIVHAGLVPALAAGRLPGSGTWTVAVLRPGAHPLRSLARALKNATTGTRIVIAVDQLEELFTACGDEDERSRFVARLVDIARDPNTRTVVTVALRSDFYGRCAAFPAFAELLSSNHVLVTAMGPEDLATAIGVPTERAGLALETGLAEALLADVVDEPGGLPLLSTTLLELWGTRDGRTLTVESYRAAGGVRTAVTRLAETAYSRLAGPEREAARTMFMRLVAGEGAALVRRRAALAEFDLATDPATRRALEVMTELRLLTVSDDSVEVAHETVLREWPRLGEWLEHDRDGRRIRVHLATAAAEWDQGGRDPAGLYRGARLSAALEWSETNPESLNHVERDFVDAARSESERDIRTQRRQNRRLRFLLGGLAVLLALAVVAGIAADVQRSRADRSATMALGQTLGADAVSEPQIDRALLLAVEGTKLANSSITQGDLLATLDRSPHIAATYYPGEGIRPNAVAVSPDGKQLTFTAYNSGKLFTYSTATRRLIRAPQEPAPGVGDVAYTPDSKTLAVLLGTNLQLLDPATGRLHRSLPVPDGVPQTADALTRALVISNEGRYAWIVFTQQSGPDSWLIRWDLTTGASREVPFRGVPFNSTVPFNMTAPAGDGDVVVNKGSRLLMFNQHTLHITTRMALPKGYSVLALTPNGSTVAISQDQGTTELLNLHTGAVEHLANGFTSSPNDAAFTPDGRKLVADSSTNGSAVVWNTATGKIVQTDPGHSDNAQAISISGDGNTAYVGSLDGSVIAFDLSGRASFGTPFAAVSVYHGPDGSGEFQPVAVSADGSTIVVPTGGQLVELRRGPGWHERTFIDGYPHTKGAWALDLSSAAVLAILPMGHYPGAVLWNIAGRHPRRLGMLPGLPYGIQSLAFTPDGRQAVAMTTADSSGQHVVIDEYNIAQRRIVRQVPTPNPAPAWSQEVAVSPDGRTAAIGFGNGNVTLYSLPSLHVLRSSAVTTDAWAVQFSPDGRTIAVGDGNGLVHLVDAHSLKPVHPPLPVHSAYVIALSFNSDGTLLATSGADGTTHIIDVAAWRAIGGPLPGSQDGWENAVFTAHDQLVTFNADGSGAVWPLSQTALTAAACRVAHRNLTATERQEFLPGRTYVPACP